MYFTLIRGSRKLSNMLRHNGKYLTSIKVMVVDASRLDRGDGNAARFGLHDRKRDHQETYRLRLEIDDDYSFQYLAS